MNFLENGKCAGNGFGQLSLGPKSKTHPKTEFLGGKKNCYEKEKLPLLREVIFQI